MTPFKVSHLYFWTFIVAIGYSTIFRNSTKLVSLNSAIVSTLFPLEDSACMYVPNMVGSFFNTAQSVTVTCMWVVFVLQLLLNMGR